MNKSAIFVGVLSLVLVGAASAQIRENRKYNQEDKFRQLDELLPTPNSYRTASGAPGHEYWQQGADYVITAELDDENQRLSGSETVTYHNNSPDKLTYLWLQLERNKFKPDSDGNLIRNALNLEHAQYEDIQRLLAFENFDGSYQISRVEGVNGESLDHTIVKTMMRIDLPQALLSGQSFEFRIDWSFEINNSAIMRTRTGAEHFEEDDNWIYEMAHWFPRMAAYTDYTGWQHKQFLGRGEFTLEFGDYQVALTVPDDHIVAATGVLQNPREVLSRDQRARLKHAESSDKPMFIITPEEALENQASPATGTKTWRFDAENVRDFAFASSRKFIWDAMGHKANGNLTMAMSYYPNEAEPLWSKYSTHAIAHTLDVYSSFTFAYPYPVAISVNGPVFGMEYPMICFNGPRPEDDGTYTERSKYGLISVVIHEVGHNYFPMIVNSDERQWTWMDEGLNTFCQYMAEQEWEDEYPSRRGDPTRIIEYMTDPRQVPIMTNSESLLQFGANAYAKPTTALNILRETIMGRELFDHAFREYAQRWMFKRPEPADFFRTMEDASGIDLDWFWRGWFYTTDHVDISIDDVHLYTIDSKDPDIEKAVQRKERDDVPISHTKSRNKSLHKRSDTHPELLDFYNEYDKLDVTPQDRKKFKEFLEELDEDELAMLSVDRNFYLIKFSNIGGLVMPIILQIVYEDGTIEELRIPAEIWARDAKHASKLIATVKTIKRITLDPHRETADADLNNNYFPPRVIESRFELFQKDERENAMKDALDALELDENEDASGAEDEGE